MKKPKILIMEKLILTLLSLFTITALQAQQKVTLAECGGDTVAYVTRNFVEGKARFIGQPFSKVMDEWKAQLPVGRLLFGDTGVWPTKEEEKNLVNSVDLYFITEDEQCLRGLKKEPYFVLGISFEPPFYQKITDYWKIQEEENSQLGPQLYEKLKDYIVKNISIVELR